MAVSYKKLWKMLIDKDMKKKDLCIKAGISTASVNEELKYNDMGQRISNQRNHYAHGDLDQEFIGLSLLDIIYLEYIVYAMQLDYYGVKEDNIRKAINDLFDLNYAL